MHNMFRFIVVLFLSVLFADRPAPTHAADTPLEYKVKAAFLLNFARFTSWPEASAKDVFGLCVVGEDPFGTAFSGVEEKQINAKDIRLLRFSSVSEALGQCQLLFLGKADQAQQDRLLKYTAHKPIATVSDIEGFAAAGGVFEFRNKEGRLSFVINNSKAKEKGIHINASLLNLALEVL